jgi:hypothetical protein
MPSIRTAPLVILAVVLLLVSAFVGGWLQALCLILFLLTCAGVGFRAGNWATK